MSAQTPYILLGISLVGLTLILRHESERQTEVASAHDTVKVEENSALTEPPKAEAAPEPEPEAPPVASAAEPGFVDFGRMPDGSLVPPLPAGAPQKVRIGVALFRYRGAQGAGPGERSREEALALAERATQAAEEGFRRAIAQADPGSNEDIGWVKRGVLERRVEYEVFSLPVAGISPQPIETPRGFWVVRRIR